MHTVVIVLFTLALTVLKMQHYFQFSCISWSMFYLGWKFEISACDLVCDIVGRTTDGSPSQRKSDVMIKSPSYLILCHDQHRVLQVIWTQMETISWSTDNSTAMSSLVFSLHSVMRAIQWDYYSADLHPHIMDLQHSIHTWRRSSKLMLAFTLVPMAGDILLKLCSLTWNHQIQLE